MGIDSLWRHSKEEKTDVPDLDETIITRFKDLEKKDPIKALILYQQILNEADSWLSAFVYFSGLKQLRENISAGFFQVISHVDYPFFPGDIIILSSKAKPKKGDIIFYMELEDDKEKLGSANYAFFQYDNKETEKTVVKSIYPWDENKYSIMPIKVFGTVIYKYEIGSKEWQMISKVLGIDLEKLEDDIKNSLKHHESIDAKGENAEEIKKYKNEILVELKNRQKIVKNLEA